MRAERFGARWGTVEPIDAEAASTAPATTTSDWLTLRIAMIGAEFEVHEPPELVEGLRALAGRVGRAVGTDSG